MQKKNRLNVKLIDNICLALPTVGSFVQREFRNKLYKWNWSFGGPVADKSL
jgi:hypothetical protein